MIIAMMSTASPSLSVILFQQLVGFTTP